MALTETRRKINHYVETLKSRNNISGYWLNVILNEILNLTDNPDGNGIYSGDGTTPSNTVATVTNKLSFIALNDNGVKVGIGTSSSDTELHVVGSVKIVDGLQGSNKVFTSDVDGLGSWQTPTNQGSGTLNTITMWTPDGATLGDSPITFDGLAALDVLLPGGSMSVKESATNFIQFAPSTNNILFNKTGAITGQLSSNGITVSRTWDLPDASGTIALLSDITGGNGIYDGNGTIPTNTVATLTDTLSFTGGNVGIGDSTPHVKLVTKGTPDQSLLTVMHLSNSLVDTTSAIGKGVGFTMGIDDGRYSAKIATVFEGNNPSYLYPALAFYTMYESSEIGTETEKLRISSNGNVGIGITTPTSKLHVQGGTPSTTKTLLIEDSLLNPNFLVRDDGFVGVGTTVQSVGEKMHIEGNLYVGNQTYPSASTIHFAQDFYRMGSVGNGRDFELYSAYVGGGGGYGFNFKFDTHTQLYIAPIQLKHVTLQVNTQLTPLNDISKKIIIQCPYDSSVGTINESPTQFNPIGNGYFPSYLDKVLGIRNFSDTYGLTDYPDNSVVGLTAFFTRGGSLSMGTDPTSLNESVRAGVTIKKGIYDCLEIDGVTPIKVRTGSIGVPSSTTVIFPFNGNAATPMQLHNGSRIKANGETRTIVSLTKAGCIVDSAVDWNGPMGDDGYDFEYQNPYLHFTDENDAAVLVVDPIGNVGIGTETPTEKLDVVGSVKIVDGLQALNKVFTSDANGLGSWQYPIVGSGGIYGGDGTIPTTTIATLTDTLTFNVGVNKAVEILSNTTNIYTPFATNSGQSVLGLYADSGGTPTQMVNFNANGHIQGFGATTWYSGGIGGTAQMNLSFGGNRPTITSVNSGQLAFSTSIGTAFANSAAITPAAMLHVQGGTPSTTKTLLIEDSLLNPNLVVQDDGFVGVGIATPISTETVLVDGAISSTDSVNIYNGATNRIKLGNDGLIEFEGGQSLGYRLGLPFAINCYGAFWVHDNSIIINGNTPTDFISQRIGSITSPIASRVGSDLTIGNDGTWNGNAAFSFGNVVLKSNDSFIYDVEVDSPLRTLGLRRNISTKTDNYTAIATDHYLKLDASSNSILLELTSFGLGSVNYTGQEFIIKAIDVTNPITVIGFADQQSILDITNPSANTFRYTISSGSLATVNVSDYIKFEQCLNAGNNGVFIVTATDSLTFVEITNISGVVELGSVGNYLINKFNKTLILNEVINVIYDHISLTFDEF